MRILLTGATGFVGKQLVHYLAANQGHDIIAAAIRKDTPLPTKVRSVVTEDLLPETDWQLSLEGVKTLIHLAARVHVMHDTAVDPLAAFRQTNTVATLNLAQQAADAGVRRFIYLSSIKVNGEYTTDKPFVPEENCVPSDSYALSKYEAEIGLQQIAAGNDMEIVIIRPPLVYGPNAKGNFLQLVHWINRGIPFPLGSIQNQRSLVGIDNLVDLITTCIEHPAAANQTFLVSDDEDISTTELLQRMGRALSKPARLIPVPPKLLGLGARLLGKQDVAQRLLGNLQVDISKTKALLGWVPPVSVDEGLRKTAEWYLQQQ